MGFLEVESVTKTYSNVVALDRLSLRLKRGEWVSIMGPSGSGKTTLLNIIAGLDRPTKGRVTIEGAAITELPDGERTRFRREHIGLIFQQCHMVPYLTALENVMIAQYYHSMADQQEATAALTKVGLGDRLNFLPHRLFGGEKQRVCVARALINDPEVILADEPTGNLDAANEAIVMDLFRRINVEGRTLVVVTHDPVIASEADTIVYLEHGRLVDPPGQKDTAQGLREATGRSHSRLAPAS